MPAGHNFFTINPGPCHFSRPQAGVGLQIIPRESVSTTTGEVANYVTLRVNPEELFDPCQITSIEQRNIPFQEFRVSAISLSV